MEGATRGECGASQGASAHNHMAILIAADGYDIHRILLSLFGAVFGLVARTYDDVIIITGPVSYRQVRPTRHTTTPC